MDLFSLTFVASASASGSTTNLSVVTQLSGPPTQIDGGAIQTVLGADGVVTIQ
jgi:hypothetical protein